MKKEKNQNFMIFEINPIKLRTCNETYDSQHTAIGVGS